MKYCAQWEILNEVFGPGKYLELHLARVCTFLGHFKNPLRRFLGIWVSFLAPSKHYHASQLHLDTSQKRILP